MYKIERKFLVNNPKEVIKYMLKFKRTPTIEATFIEQYYENSNTRYRKETHVYSGVDKYEYNINYPTELKYRKKNASLNITEMMYKCNIKSNKIPLYRERYTVKTKYSTWHLDLYNQFDIYVVEIEFSNVKGANAFNPKFPYIKEVTEDEQYNGFNLYNKLQNIISREKGI